jgi:uncharacterized Zn finger protein
MTGPYAEAEWQREWDAGVPLACPRCGSSEDFGPRQGVRPNRTFRRYRACRRCGLFQEADGESPPYQAVLLVHECTGSIEVDAQCRSCGLRVRTGGRHMCPRIVREGESLTCPECGTVVAEPHRRPWPLPGPWGP